MDIEKIKKYAQSEFDGFQIKKAVTAVKNEIKDNEQGRDYFNLIQESSNCFLNLESIKF